MTQPLPQVRFPKFSYEVKMAAVSVLIAPGALFGGWEIGRVTDHQTDVPASVIVVTASPGRAPETTSMTPAPKAGEREGAGRPVSRGPALAVRTTAPAPTRTSVPTTAPPSETPSVRTTSASPTSVSEDPPEPSSSVPDPGRTTEEPKVHGVGNAPLGHPAGG